MVTKDAYGNIVKYRNVDTSVKHLQHRKDVDLAAPDPEMVKADMQELIKEARAKIKPVIQVMPDEEVRALCKTLDELKEDKQVVINDSKMHEVMERIGITLEELRKI